MLPRVGVCVCVFVVCIVCVCVSRLTFVLTFDVKNSFRVCVCVCEGNPPPFNVVYYNIYIYVLCQTVSVSCPTLTFVRSFEITC